MKRSHCAWTLVALAGLGLLAGCTAGASVSTASRGAASSPPAASSPAASSPGIASPTAAPSSGSSPSALVAAALAALRAGPTVHVAISSAEPSGTLSYSDDASANGGQQKITLSSGGQVDIIYLGRTGFVWGNPQGLAGFLGVPVAQAPSLAGQWIAVTPGEQLGQSSYSDIVDGITLSSVATEISLDGTLTLTSPATVAGQRAIGVRGGVPASQGLPSSARATLDLAATGSRPLRWTASAAGGYQSTISFSDWGEPLHLAAPPDSIPASSLEVPTLN